MLSVAEVKPSLLKISDTLSVRFQKIGSGPPLLLLHTIWTQLEYFRSLALAGWRSWSKARDYYRQISAPVTLIYGDSDCLGQMSANAHGR